jgi:hypothetical protein
LMSDYGQLGQEKSLFQRRVTMETEAMVYFAFSPEHLQNVPQIVRPRSMRAATAQPRLLFS